MLIKTSKYLLTTSLAIGLVISTSYLHADVAELQGKLAGDHGLKNSMGTLKESLGIFSKKLGTLKTSLEEIKNPTIKFDAKTPTIELEAKILALVKEYDAKKSKEYYKKLYENNSTTLLAAKDEATFNVIKAKIEKEMKTIEQTEAFSKKFPAKKSTKAQEAPVAPSKKEDLNIKQKSKDTDSSTAIPSKEETDEWIENAKKNPKKDESRKEFQDADDGGFQDLQTAQQATLEIVSNWQGNESMNVKKIQAMNLDKNAKKALVTRLGTLYQAVKAAYFDIYNDADGKKIPTGKETAPLDIDKTKIKTLNEAITKLNDEFAKCVEENSAKPDEHQAKPKERTDDEIKQAANDLAEKYKAKGAKIKAGEGARWNLSKTEVKNLPAIGKWNTLSNLKSKKLTSQTDKDLLRALVTDFEAWLKANPV